MFVKEREIFAHKVVLAAVSPALFDLFLSADEAESDGRFPWAFLCKNKDFFFFKSDFPKFKPSNRTTEKVQYLERNRARLFLILETIN